MFIPLNSKISQILTNVVLHCVHGICHLPRPAAPSQLVAQLDGLRNSGGPNWMAFADEATAGIYHPFPAIGVIASVHNVACLPNRAKAQCFIGDQLVWGEAIVELNDLKMPNCYQMHPSFACLNLLGIHTRFAVQSFRDAPDQVESNHFDVALLREYGGLIYKAIAVTICPPILFPCLCPIQCPQFQRLAASAVDSAPRSARCK